MASASDSNCCDSREEAMSLPLATTIKGGTRADRQTMSTDSSSSDSSSKRSVQNPKKSQKPSKVQTDDKRSKSKEKTKGSRSNDPECPSQNSQSPASPGTYSQLMQKHSRKSEKSTKFRQQSSSPRPSSATVRQHSSSPRPPHETVCTTGATTDLTVFVEGFPSDISQDELSSFFLSMYPVCRVDKVEKPQGKFTGCVSVTFVLENDMQDFLARDMVLYDDMELTVSPVGVTARVLSENVSQQGNTGKEKRSDRDRHHSKHKQDAYQQQKAEKRDDQTNSQEKTKNRKHSGRQDKGRQIHNSDSQMHDSNGSNRDLGKSKGRGDKRKERQRKAMFEPHWPMEKVSDGLKRGELIQGPIRINPKNYEECYIPHPNGVSDIFISGMLNRNRAMNGDVVAVMLFDQEHWRVNEGYVKSLEEDEEMEGEEEKESEINQQNSAIRSEDDPVSTDPVSGYQSDPDVIVEEEEEVILEDENKAEDLVQVISESLGQVIIEDKQATTGNERASECYDKIQGQSQNNRKETSQDAIRSKTEVVEATKQQKTSDKNNSMKKGTPQGTPKKHYVSVDDMVKAGSPVVKGLFQDGQIGESRTALRVVQMTGKVVAIIEKKHSRASVGYIKPMSDNNKTTALFCPKDSRVPRIIIPVSDCPKDFLERPEDHAQTLFICRLVEWRDNSMMAHGNLKRSLGEAGQIEPETEGMLLEHDVDYSEFSQEAIDSLPLPAQGEEWRIPESELETRRDFRQQCVFTIDPATARDLDDALSIEVIDDDLFEVGVHIADVSYFLQEGTILDKVASHRATSVYLVQKVIPMLPRILCEILCSLNPDTARLTFSVTWKMNSAGEVFEEWFGRSVIQSCCKLSYDHAQGFINDPDREWTVEELPPISTGFSVEDIKKRVLLLHKIAQNLRKARFDNGALRLDQVKLQFSLDKETLMPNGYSVYVQKDSNRLVEEFMLLANMAVAHKIYKTYPETALLRRHPPPQTKMADDLSDLCQNLGVPIDITSSATLQQSLWRYLGEDEFSLARMQVLTSLCSKPMQNAKYFCIGCLDEDLYGHYALSVPLYTHFTSPIRRYADVIVHRMLAAALGYSKEPNKSKYQIQGQAEICNDKKTNAKRVEELSAELFFALFVKEAGPFEEKAMVMGVLDKAFDVFVLKLGVTKRVYCDKLDLQDHAFIKEQKQPVLNLIWNPQGKNTEVITQRITIFTVVDCIIQAGELPLQWKATISCPKSAS